MNIKLILLLGVLFVIAGCTNGSDNIVEDEVGAVEDDDSDDEEISDDNGDVEDSIEDKESDSFAVEFTSSGYSPSSLEINVGDTVIFTNKDSSRSTWPASIVHPTHKNYPGSDINKCGTSEESGIFDACGGLSEGESYEFTFNEAGTWGYHDHLKPSFGGTIVVK